VIVLMLTSRSVAPAGDTLMSASHKSRSTGSIATEFNHMNVEEKKLLDEGIEDTKV